MRVPWGTRTLYVSCSNDKQFRGIRRLFAELAKPYGSHLLDWQQGTVDLHRRRVLRRVLISGHATAEQAGFELSSSRAMRPSSLSLPSGARLYLMGCYQGGAAQRRSWAEGSGIAVDAVSGCSGETESAVSTCLLLHVLEEGAESIDRWFPVWALCNDSFRPFFPMIRATYGSLGADPLAALNQLKARENLKPLFRDFDEYLGVIARRPSYLADLV
ncbi:MAG: hypothetical protein JXB06_13900 [Spirochaetales bacterium]|nr:hypothetical protein [Spirochaetales bacterium]